MYIKLRKVFVHTSLNHPVDTPPFIAITTVSFILSSVNIPMVNFLCLFLTIIFINHYKIIDILKTKKKFLQFMDHMYLKNCCYKL